MKSGFTSAPFLGLLRSLGSLSATCVFVGLGVLVACGKASDTAQQFPQLGRTDQAIPKVNAPKVVETASPAANDTLGSQGPATAKETPAVNGTPAAKGTPLRAAGAMVACTEERARANSSGVGVTRKPVTLPPKYASLCADCHGASAEGKGSAPRLVGVSPETLRETVRSGRAGVMPLFSMSALADAELNSIVDALFTPPEEDASACQFNPDLFGDQSAGNAGTGIVSPTPKADLVSTCLAGSQTFLPGPIPTTYTRLCADCHGGDGMGKGPHPKLVGLTKESLLQMVRAGSEGKMPSFEKELIAESDLHQLVATWNGAPLTVTQLEACAAVSPGPTPVPTPGSTVGPTPGPTAAPTPTPVPTPTAQQIRAQGMAAARKPDARGFACVSCHAPDLYDLAVLGFDEATLSRRALAHVSGDDAKSVFRYVQQLRKDENLADRDPQQVRPFQPGGAPLACTDPLDCDFVFGKEFVKRVPALALARIGTAAEAEAFKQQMLALNPRSMPIGITLNRWTEDEFRGPEHSRFNEWVPDISYLPNTEADRTALLALHDAYIADPTWATLMSIINALSTRATVPEAQGEMKTLLQEKYKSVLVGAHLMRLEAKGESFASMPAYINAAGLPRHGSFNPFWSVGDLARKLDTSGTDASYLPLFAPEQLVKIQPPYTPRSEILSMRLTWFWLGFLFDNGVMHSGDTNSTRSTEYFTSQMYGLRYYTHVAYMRFQKVFAQAYREGSSIRADGKQWLASASTQGWGYFAAYGSTWRDDTRAERDWKMPPMGEKRELFLQTQANLVRANALLLTEEAGAIGVENKDGLKQNIAWMASWLMKTIHGKDFAAGETGLTGDALADHRIFSNMNAVIDAACEKRPLNYKELTYPNRCPL